MFAVIKTGGKQYRVQAGDVLEVEKLKVEPSLKVIFDQVLLIGDEGSTLIGTPFVEKAAVRAEVVETLKDDKVIVFKKKRRKQYRRTRGHRQQLTRVRIEEIIPDFRETGEAPPAGLEPAVAGEEIIGKKAVAPEEKKPTKKEAKPRARAEAKAGIATEKQVKPKKRPEGKATPEKKTKKS